MSFWSDLGDLVLGKADQAADEWIAEQFPEKTVPVDNTTAHQTTPDHLDELEAELRAKQTRNTAILAASAGVVLILGTILVTRL
jgi:hypothetical protein